MKSLEIYWVVSNLFCLYHLESIFFLILIKLLRQLIKIAFPCSGILSLCFVKSLGLDITSVILTSFKMAATYLLFFVIYFYGKEIWRIDSFVIHFTSKKFSKFRQIWLYFEFKLVRIWTFQFIYWYWGYTYKVSITYSLLLTLDFAPR